MGHPFGSDCVQVLSALQTLLKMALQYQFLHTPFKHDLHPVPVHVEAQTPLVQPSHFKPSQYCPLQQIG
jgi:hypothetical protein